MVWCQPARSSRAQPTMLNFRVRDLDAMRAQLRATSRAPLRNRVQGIAHQYMMAI